MQGEDEKGESSEHCYFGTSAGTSPMACQEREKRLWVKALMEKKPAHKAFHNVRVELAVEGKGTHIYIY